MTLKGLLKINGNFKILKNNSSYNYSLVKTKITYNYWKVMAVVSRKAKNKNKFKSNNRKKIN